MGLQTSMAATDGAIDGHLILILCIMIATGILGGIANYFLNERDSNAPWRTATKYAVLGVVASLTVPLFLNMISSHMLEATRLKSSELFVFSGFCLLYVVVSRRFFENLAVQLMRQVEMVRKDMRHLQESGERHAPAPAHRAAENEPQEAVAASVVELPRNAVSYGDIELMRAIGEGNAIYGALTGLAAKTTLPRDQVAPRLAALKGMALIESKMDDKNVVRWYLTPKGKSLLDGITAAASLEEKRDAS
jgi:DNA-binding MarR family transcriptional regulator